jgi:hypothetical protein
MRRFFYNLELDDNKQSFILETFGDLKGAYILELEASNVVPFLSLLLQ